MVKVLRGWFEKHLSDPEVVGLVLLLLILFGIVALLGGLLTPVLASVVIAYLFNGLVTPLERLRVPHTVAVTLVCFLFVSVFYLSLFVLVPVLWEQLSKLFNELPKIFSLGNDLINNLNQRFPDYIWADQIKQVIVSFKGEIGRLGQVIVSYSISSLTSLISIVVYLVLVPLMVFFLLKDNQEILHWFSQYVPQQRRLISQVWCEVNNQIGNFVRAKVVEILIVTLVSVLTFYYLQLNYAVLLGVLVGLSVLIPYVGVTLVTIPVILIAYLQWGWNADFAWLVAAYGVIAVVDGNVLAPLLFSEAVKLHPLAVIIAIFVFGGIWGFWGVFFAIPLATLVKAILNVWPRHVLSAVSAESS